MTRFACPALILLFLGTVATAQPANNRPTGLSPGSSGLGSQELIDYLKAFRTADTNVEIETRGATRRMFGAHRISITANWRKKPGSDGPVLHSATIRPTAGGRLKLGDHEINSLTINSKGEIQVDRKGIDVTIYKITRRANGDLVLDLPWWAFGDPVIKAADVPFDIKKWPPELQQLIEAVMNPRNNGRTSTQHEARVNWNVTGEADPHKLPFGDGNLKVASSVNIRGAGELRPDGTFRTIGNGNDLSLELRVNRGGNVSTPMGAGGRIDSGRVRFNGKYGINVPAANGGFALAVDGRLDYTLDGSRIILNVPGGPRISAANGHIDGNGQLTGSFGAGGSDVSLRDGVYNLKLDGPIGITGLRTDAFSLDDLDLEGSLTSSGTLDEASADRILARGNWNGELVAGDATGIRGALTGERAGQGSIRRGSRIAVNSDDARFEANLSGPNRGATVTGKVEAEADLTVDDLKVESGDMSAEAEAARIRARLEGDLGTPGKILDNANGRIDVEVLEGGALTTRGLPGAPVLPAGERKHVVQPNDTLHSIARDYGVPVDRLRAANNLSAPGKARYRVNASSLRVRSGPGTDHPQVGSLDRGQEIEVDKIENGWARLADGNWVSADFLDALPANANTTIRPGQELVIPGGAPQVDNSRRDGSLTTNLDNGTTATVELTDGSIDRDGKIRARGFVSSTLRLRDVDLKAATLEAKLLGAAQATLPRTAFEVGGQGPGFNLAEIKIPVRIDLSRGSRVQTMASPGREMDLQFDKDGSYAEFTVVARYENGRLRIPELQEVDLLLHSNSAARFAGEVVDISGDKSLSFKGRLVILQNGLDFMGDVAIISRGSDTRPALRIRW